MLIESSIQGVNSVGTDGPTVTIRAGRSRQLMVADAQARYYDMVKNGNVYVAANTAATALSTNSTTATGFIITNPPGSGKDLVLLELCIALATAPAGAAPIILTGSVSGAVTHTTPITNITSAYFGGGQANQVALFDSAATVPTPAIRRVFGGGPVAASSITPPFIKDELAGAIVMSAGSCLSVQCLTTAISALCSLTWMEVPV